MMPLFRTSHIEHGLIALAKSHDRIVARAVYALERPIRLRANLLDGDVYFARYNDNHSEQVTAWQKGGGILINHITNPFAHAHDALLFVECPASLDAIEDQSRNTKKVICVYRPPNWTAHEDLVYRLSPPVDICRRFTASIIGTALSREHLSLCRLLEIPVEGLVGSTHNAIADSVGITYREIKHLHKKILAGRRESYFEIQPLIPRVEPESTSLAELYGFIRDGLPNIRGVRYAVNNSLSKAMKMWRIPLRMLVREGCVEKGEKIGLYVKDRIRPDFERIEIEHATARAKLARLIKEVDAAPDLLRRQPAKSRSQSSSAQA